MEIRDAVRTDLGEIGALIHELAAFERLAHEVTWSPDQLERHLFAEPPAARVLIAEADGGEVVGMALWFPTFSTFLGEPGIWLEDLFVRPAHRGAGIGRALLDAVRERTGGRVEWAVLDWNEPAIELYRSLGAAPVDGWTRFRWLPTS